MSAHLYWSLNVTDVLDPDYTLEIVELEMRSAIDGINQCIGGIATATSQSNVNHPPSKAFDGVIEYGELTWIAEYPFSAPQRLSYQFLSAIDIVEYKIYVFNDVPDAPKSWTLEYSNDGVNWFVAHTVSSHLFPVTPAISYDIFQVPPDNSTKVDFELQIRLLDLLVYDFQFSNRLTDLFAFYFNINSRLAEGVNFELKNSLVHDFNFELSSRTMIETYINFEFKTPLITVYAFDFEFKTLLESYTISKADFNLISCLELEQQSIVIDVHNPETPIYGTYL